MDALFHVGSASLLAYGLGERRPRVLLAAGALGLAPDVLWLPAQFSPDLWLCYTVPHSLLFNVTLCGAVGVFIGWRIAWGPLLHIAIDVCTHASSTKHLLFPFSDRKLFTTISWWSGSGLILWLALWLLLIASAVFIFTRAKRLSRPSSD